LALRDDLNQGRIGFFWPVAHDAPMDLGAEPLRGHLAREGQWARLETLEEDLHADALMTEDLRRYQGIVGSLPERPVLLLEVRPDGYSRNFGGGRASVQFNAARTVIGDVPLYTLTGLGVRSLSVRFLGVTRWAGRSSVTETSERGLDGRVRAYTTRVEGGEPERVRLPRGGRLVIAPDWLTEGSRDERLVLAPTKVTCEFNRPQDIWTVLQPLVLVQDLLSFVHRGFVPAHSGTAEVEVSDPDSPRPRPSMWNGLLMETIPGVDVASTQLRPLVSLQQLGGPRGLARWIRIGTDHPRAIDPFVGVHRFGPATRETALRDVAAGIEYWVAAHRRTASWAAEGPHAEVVAKHLGRSFLRWSGGSVAWATRFWAANNDLKHNPNVAHDPMILADLAWSGRLVLAAAVLNEVAGTKRPAESIFSHVAFDRLGARIKAMVGATH
jgi:hypothetical protein